MLHQSAVLWNAEGPQVCRLCSSLVPKPLYESEDTQEYWDVPLYAEHTYLGAIRVDVRFVDHKVMRVLAVEMSCSWLDNRTRKLILRSKKSTNCCGVQRGDRIVHAFAWFRNWLHQHNTPCLISLNYTSIPFSLAKKLNLLLKHWNCVTIQFGDNQVVWSETNYYHSWHIA